MQNHKMYETDNFIKDDSSDSLDSSVHSNISATCGYGGKFSNLVIEMLTGDIWQTSWNQFKWAIQP